MNSKLYNKYYNIPDNVLEYINSKLNEYSNLNIKGKKKANFLLKEKKISYQNLKRYKNFFDYFSRKNYNLTTDDTSINDVDENYEYHLSGGNLMKNFVDETLKKEREFLNKKKKVSTELGGMYNQYNKETPHDNLKINTQNNFIKESKKINNKNILLVALSVIFNKEGKILLLKRSETTSWFPNHWAFVGGKIEKGETPENALVREIYEETKIKLTNFKIKKIIKDNNIIEYLYLSRVGDDTIILNSEHTDYRWYSIEDIKKLENKVPDIINYIKFVII